MRGYFAGVQPSPRFSYYVLNGLVDNTKESEDYVLNGSADNTKDGACG